MADVRYKTIIVFNLFVRMNATQRDLSSVVVTVFEVVKKKLKMEKNNNY